jgi:hypothetical protein
VPFSTARYNFKKVTGYLRACAVSGLTADCIRIARGEDGDDARHAALPNREVQGVEIDLRPNTAS